MLVELFILAILLTLVVLGIRGGRSAALDKPLIIQSPGRYHITLAPQLDRAQTFIDQIAGQFAQALPFPGDIPGQYFAVRDPDVLAQEGKFYLLAVSYIGRLLYFQAIDPQPLLRDSDSHLKQVREFSEAVLALHPLAHPADDDEVAKLRNAVDLAARNLNISVKPLTETE
jgi:hypothetical protein